VHAQRPGIDGVYFLFTMPDIATSPIGPTPFKDGYALDFTKCMKAVRRDWRPLEQTRIEWEQWWDLESPRSDTAEQYVARKGLDIPLMRFKEKHATNTASLWTVSLQSSMPVQPPPKDAFPWPQLVAMAMPGVKSKWTGEHVPPSRIYATRDGQDALKEGLTNISEICKPIYVVLSSKTNDFLKSTLRRRVTDGVRVAVGGTKESLVKKIQSSDRIFFTRRNRKLEPSSNTLVQCVLSLERLPQDIQGPKKLWWYEVAVNLALSDVQQFNPGESLEPSTMTYALALMQTRDTRLATAHKDVNSDKDNYTAYQSSAFMPPEFMQLVALRQMAAAKTLFDRYCGTPLDKLFQLYVPWYHLSDTEGVSKWTAYTVRLAPGLVDLQQGGFYFDPTCTGKQM
jgi:hypothetical protein